MDDIITDIDTILSLLSDPKDDILLQPIDSIINRVSLVLNNKMISNNSKDLMIDVIHDIMKIKNNIDLINQNLEFLTINDIIRIRALRIIFEGMFNGKL